MKRRMEFCGAFSGWVTLRKGETPEQALDRMQDAIQSAIDNRRSLDVNIGVDFGEGAYKVEEDQS